MIIQFKGDTYNTSFRITAYEYYPQERLINYTYEGESFESELLDDETMVVWAEGETLLSVGKAPANQG